MTIAINNERLRRVNNSSSCKKAKTEIKAEIMVAILNDLRKIGLNSTKVCSSSLILPRDSQFEIINLPKYKINEIVKAAAKKSKRVKIKS